jgi:hypothetical protein
MTALEKAMTEREQAELKEWQDKACNLRHELNVAEAKIARLEEENRRIKLALQEALKDAAAIRGRKL